MNEEQPEPTEQSGKTIANYLGVFFFRLFEWIIILLPVGIVCRIGMLAGWLGYMVLPSRRKIVARNLRIVIDPKLRGKELDKKIKENFIRMGMHMLGSTKTATMSDKALSKHIKLMGVDIFDDPDTQQHGLICIVGHSGNWEILSRTYIFLPAAKLYGSMYRKMDNPLLEHYLYTKRTNNGAHMFSKEGGIQAPLAFLKSGGGLGVLSDQFVQEGVFVPYFGKVTGTTYLPALMQKRARSKMKPCVAASTKPAFWICHTSNGLSIEDTPGSLAETTIAVNRMLEEQISKSPLDGFWMHHRWKVGEHFAPQDSKTAKVLETLDLKPFRILFATPVQFEEAVLCVPMVKALKHCRCDMQITIICPEEQTGFWKTIGEITYVIPQGKAADLEKTLFTPELYNDGPLDLAFLLDDSPETVKALEKLQPITFSGFSTHPCTKLRSFKTVATPTSFGPVKHRIEDYLHLLDRHSIPHNNPAFFPTRKPSETSSLPHLLIAPFSTLGDANEWAEENWKTLVKKLNGIQATLISLPQHKDRAENLAAQLEIPFQIGDTTELLKLLAETQTVIAVDGLIPALAAHTGTPCVTLFSTRLPARYRPLGSYHHSLHRHRSCSPCFLSTCDQKTKCVNDITPDQVYNAYSSITAE